MEYTNIHADIFLHHLSIGIEKLYPGRLRAFNQFRPARLSRPDTVPLTKT
ncbi:hypothetical protein ACU6ZM_23745 [Klebsiella aerogenes]